MQISQLLSGLSICFKPVTPSRFRVVLLVFLLWIGVLLLLTGERTIPTGDWAKWEGEEVIPFYNAPKIAVHLDCGRVLANDADYISAITTEPLTQNGEEAKIPMDCASIRQRHYFPRQPLSDEEAQWPWALARNVYRDYLMLEAELASGYTPQNWYCYAVDAKAGDVFHSRIHALASCFPNVVVVPEKVNISRHGVGTIPSWLNCLRQLAIPDRVWKYVSLQQNHDVQIKTNAEVVRILQLLDGANDIATMPMLEGRYNTAADWSFHSLNLFQDPERNEQYSSNGYAPQLLFTYCQIAQSSLTRAMVEFMLGVLNLTTLIKRQEEWNKSSDELVLSTLNAADALQAPGGFTRVCAERGIPTPTVARKTIDFAEPQIWLKCLSGTTRHRICLYGLADLHWLASASVVEMFANKMWPEADYGAIACWHEWMFNLTNNLVAPRLLNESFYRELPQVRFQEFKRQKGTTAKALEKFHC